MAGHPARTTCSEVCPVPVAHCSGSGVSPARNLDLVAGCFTALPPARPGAASAGPSYCRRGQRTVITRIQLSISSNGGIKGALLRYASTRGSCQNIDPTVCWAADVPHRLGLSTLARKMFWKGPWKKSPEQILTMRTNCWSCGRGTILGRCWADLWREFPSWEQQLS